MLDEQRSAAIGQLLSSIEQEADLRYRPDLLHTRACAHYLRAKQLFSLAQIFHNEPIGRLLELEALCAARCAAEVLL